MLMEKLHFDGPVVLVVMDGVGLSQTTKGNALAYAKINFLRNTFLKPDNILPFQRKLCQLPRGVSFRELEVVGKRIGDLAHGALELASA